MADISRIEREMYSLTSSKYVPVTKVERINSDNLEWKVVFDGPEASAYEDGIFTIKFKFPQNYPTNGPEALFITKMFHQPSYSLYFGAFAITSASRLEGSCSYLANSMVNQPMPFVI